MVFNSFWGVEGSWIWVLELAIDKKKIVVRQKHAEAINYRALIDLIVGSNNILNE